MNASTNSTSDMLSLLKAARNADDLRSLNEILTHSMAERSIQALIKGDNLDVVSGSILRLVGPANTEHELLAAAMLGRLAAVARGRESKVFDRIPNLFSREPPSIESLTDGDEKSYAAQSLRYASGEWLTAYCVRESISIDTSDIARRELLSVALDRHGMVANWLRALTVEGVTLRTVENPNARLKRVRRIFECMFKVTKDWQGDLGSEPGAALAECLAAFTRGDLTSADELVLYEALDFALSILTRMIEVRFSHALNSNIYAALEQGKKILGSSAWSRFLSESKVMPSLRTDLLEAALVLARQNRTDKHIMSSISAAFTSRAQIGVAIKRHFSEAKDLDLDVREWWVNGGVATEDQRKVEHKVGNTEDQQIGALLIEVESNSEAMEKLVRAVVPLLEISDPVLSATVRKAATGYLDMAQIARRLARMRRLTKTDLNGERLEYNPLEHEMLGGHKPGIRKVKVIRDGIKKEFGGSIKTLVKPWVVPEE